MNNLIFYISNILLFMLPVSLIEIGVEKAHGWGSGFSKDKWYAKSILEGTLAEKLITSITKCEPPMNYHIIIMILFPAVFITEYLFGAKNILLLLACYTGVNFFGDIFWFMFNWHFHSMRELLKGPNGSIFWHKNWIKIGRESYIPFSYPLWLGLSLFFLFLSYIK